MFSTLNTQHSTQISNLKSQILNLHRGPWLIVAIFLLLLPLSTPRIYATDEVQYYVYLRSLRFDGDLDFANDYRRFAELNPRSGIAESLLQPNRIRPATGRYGNIAPVGAAIMWAPAFVLADGLVHLANIFGAGIPADGFSWPYIYAVCYASALYGLLGLLLAYRLARRYASPFATTLASVTIWLATPLVFYMHVQMPWSHATAFFLVALFLTIWQEMRGVRVQGSGFRVQGSGGGGRRRERTRADGEQGTRDRRRETGDGRRETGDGRRETGDRRPETGDRRPFILHPSSFILHPSSFILHPSSFRWRAWIALGVVGGLMTMAREQLGLLLIVPAVEALVGYGRALIKGERLDHGGNPIVALLGRHTLFLAVFLLTLTPQFVAYTVLNGTPRPAGEVSGKLNFCSPHMIDTLIDYDPRPSPWCNVIGDPTAGFPPFAHGALIWSPVLVPALLGLALLWRRDTLLALALALAFFAQTYVNGAFGSTWHLSGSFGFRRLIECTPIFILGLALLIDRMGARPWLIAPALLFVAWNVALILNWTIFNAETQLRQGMLWPELWRWQAEAPLKALSRIGDLLFQRCRLFENARC